MSKERVYTGYAVVSRDILDDKKFKKGSFGIALNNPSLETCKEYCFGKDIVVKTYRQVLARYVTFKWIKKYPSFEISRRYSYPHYIQLWWLRIEFGTINCDGYEREIVWEREDSTKK